MAYYRAAVVGSCALCVCVVHACVCVCAFVSVFRQSVTLSSPDLPLGHVKQVEIHEFMEDICCKS